MNIPYIHITDETLRDGAQGDVVMTPAFKINHILTMEKMGWADEIRLGWLNNAIDDSVLTYLEKYAPDTMPKIAMCVPVDLGNNANISTLYEQFSADHRFGIASLITKGRPQDLADLGTNTEGMITGVAKSVCALKQGAPGRSVEMAIEHAFASYHEGNQDYLEQLMAKALIAGVTKITLADTDGAMMPQQITAAIQGMTTALQNNAELKAHHIQFTPSMFSVHTHNDLGLGAANILAALAAGVREADISHNNYGERSGNSSLLQTAAILHHSGVYRCGVQQGDLSLLADYTAGLHHTLGSKLGDRAFGSKDAFNAVGGMHASTLLKAYRKLHAETGISIQDFKTTLAYTGSYNSVPAPEMGGEINVVLSPAAGKANVLFILEEMGVSGIEESDVRINQVLQRVKHDEMHLGINYRGRHNANAYLLLAETFGLRKDSEGHEHAASLTLDRTKNMALKVRDKKIIIGTLPTSPYAAHLSEETCIAIMAASILAQTASALQSVDSTFHNITVKDARYHTIEVGEPHPPENNVLPVKGQTTLHALTLVMQEGKEEWRVHGTGNTVAEALVNAVEKAVDYHVLNLEQKRTSQGESMLFDDATLQKAAVSSSRTVQVQRAR
jgi:isopropylmalate/homocitrate/citramalate synthase